MTLIFFGGQKGGHRLVNILVGTGYNVAFVLHGDRGRSHGGAPDANEMDGFDVCRKHCRKITHQRPGAQTVLFNL